MNNNNKDFLSQLEDIIQDLEEFPEEVEEQIVELGDEFIGELKKTHNAGEDPYGNSWAPRKHDYAWPALKKTGNLYNSYEKAKSNDSVSISDTADYAVYHQEGTSNMAQRKILPDSEIPDSWWEHIEEAADKAVENFNKNKK